MQMNSQKRENTETTILALLLSRKGGCTLTQLTKDYYEMEGEHIPWKELGYVSLLNFLRSMPRSVQIKYENNTAFLKGIASNKSKHVSKLVDGQKNQKHLIGRKLFKPSHYYPMTNPPRIRLSHEILTVIISLVNDHPDGVNKDFILQNVQSQMPSANILMSDLEEQLRALSHQIYQSNNKVFPIQSKSINDLFDSESVMITASGNENSDDMSDHKDDFEFVPCGYVPTAHTKSIAKTKSTSSFIKETLSKCQDQVTESRNVEHTLKVQSDQNNSCNLYNYNCNDNDQIHKEFNINIDKETSLDSKRVEMLINQRVQFRLEKLIQNNPDGIWCADLPQKYLEEYKLSLNYTELGFNSVREFASYLPEIFHCVQPQDTGDFMLYYAKRKIPSENKLKEKENIVNLAKLYHIYTKDDEIEALPISLSLDTCKKLIPDGTVTIGESVGQLNVTDLVDNEKPYIEVIVVEVFTPSFFWIQLRRKQNSFKTFMHDLHKFYTVKHEEYVIPPVILEKGLNCVCMYNGIWHRGIIKSVKPDLQVTVMFYDYGTLKTYPPEALHYLHRMFSTIPAQAIPCGLINTRPYKGSKWSRSATHHFAVRTSQIPLIATIASVNVEDNSMMVTLTDTLDEEDVHINDWLVEQRLAEHGKMGDNVDMNNLFLYVEENLMFSPDQCYEEENNVPNTNKKNSEETSINAPLISPQSTLGDKLFKSPTEITLFDKPQKLTAIKEEHLQDQIFKDDSLSTIITPKKTNTNPFLQDDSMHDEIKADITPEKFMQLWNENLKLQMQITATFNVLFNKVIKNSDTDIDNNPTEDENMHGNKNISTSLTVNTASASPVTISSITNGYSDTKSPVMNCDFTNFGHPTGNSTLTTTNHSQSLYASSSNRNLTPSNYVEFLQNSGIQNSIRNLNSIYSNLFIFTDNNFDTTNQFSMNKQISKNTSVPPGFENINPKFNLDGQNSSNNANINVSTSFKEPINNITPFKETNPFKLSLAGKLRISNSPDENCLSSDDIMSVSYKNRESVIEPDLISFEKDNSKIENTKHNVPENLSRETSFNHHQYFYTNNSSNTNSTDNNLPALNAKSASTDYTWSVENATNNMSKIMIDHPFIMHNINQVKETNKHVETDNGNLLSSQNCNYETFAYTPSYLRISSQEYITDQKQKEDLFIDHNVQTFEKINEQKKVRTNDASNFHESLVTRCNNYDTIHENCTLTSNNDVNICKSSSWLPINSFVLPISVAQDTTNIDEGYLTRPSTSHTSYKLSTLVQPTDEAECGKQLLHGISNELCDTPTKASMKSMEDTIAVQLDYWDKMYLSFKKNQDRKVTRAKSQQQNSKENAATEDVEVQVNIDHVGVNNLYLKESELRNIWNSPVSKESTYANRNCPFPTYSSPKRKIFFHIIKLSNRVIHIFHHQGEGWLLANEFVTFTEFKTVSYMLNFLGICNIDVPFEEIDKSQYSIEYTELENNLQKTTLDIMYDANNLLLIPLRSTLELLNKIKSISSEDFVMHEIWLVVNAYEQFKHYIESSGHL